MKEFNKPFGPVLVWRGRFLCSDFCAFREPRRYGALRPANNPTSQLDRAGEFPLCNEVVNRAAAQAGKVFDFLAAIMFFYHVSPDSVLFR